MTIYIQQWIPAKESVLDFQDRLSGFIREVMSEELEDLVYITHFTHFKDMNVHYFILEFDTIQRYPENDEDESGYFENLQWNTIGVAVLLSTLSGIISSVLLSL